MTAEPLVLISALEHYVYCPRQCALIHVDGLWQDNRHTVRGRRIHRRVDEGGHRKERGRKVFRGQPLYSERFGLTGRSDVVELHPDGRLVPVEYKAGVQHGRAADVQLCAQALCLEEMFDCTVAEGFVWYAGWRRRRRVALDAELRSITVALVRTIRRMIIDGVLPPAVADARCTECQLEATCLPQVVFRPEMVDNFVEEDLFRCG